MANEDTQRRVERALGNRAELTTGQDTVATAGTAVALNGGTSEPIPDGAVLAVRANGDNSTPVYVGDDTVDTSSGFKLTAGDGLNIRISDVTSVYVDAETSGDGVSWAVEVDA